MTSDIPQSILDKIDSDYPMGNGRYSTSFRGYNKMQEIGRKSAKYGYSLALPTINELKDHNDVLITALSLSNAGRRKLSTQVDELKQENEAYKEKVIELLYSHYKNNGGFTRTAATFIEKLTGKKWERDEEIKNLEQENETLKQRIKELEERNTFLTNGYDMVWEAYIKTLSEEELELVLEKLENTKS